MEAEPPADVQREVELMLPRLRRLAENGGGDTSEFIGELARVEASLAELNGAAGSFGSRQLVDEIGGMRATLCVEQASKRHESVDCDSFMSVVCSLEGDTSMVMDGRAQQAPLVSEPACQQFLQERREQAQEQEEAIKQSKQSASSIKNSTEEKKELLEDEEGGNGTEAGGETILGGMKRRPLPSQGYNEYDGGQMVQHEDVKTSTGDWQKERKGRDIYAICKDFPDNEWCKLHTYRPTRGSRSAAARLPTAVGSVCLAVIMAVALSVA